MATFEEHLKEVRYDDGIGSIQPVTLWTDTPLYSMGLQVQHLPQNDDELTTRLFNIAPVGYTDPNPVNVQADFNDPVILGGGVPTVRTDDSPLWKECK